MLYISFHIESVTGVHQIYRAQQILLIISFEQCISTNIQVLQPVQEGPASSTVRHGRNMGMPPHFEELLQEGYVSNCELCADACSSGDLSNEDVSLPDSHALLHVTSRRKPNTTVIDSHF